MYHWRVGLAYCIQTLKTVSRENGLVNYDFQELTLILGFCAPKNGNNGLILCFIE